MERGRTMARELPDRIVMDPEVLSGKPTIEGTRISVEIVLELMASGLGIDEVLEEYPSLEREDVLAALDYAARTVGREEVYRLE